METSFKRLISCKITTKGSIGLHPFAGYFQWLPYDEPLLQYAYESWYRHVRESIPDPALSDAEPIPTILRFLEECTSYPALFLKYNKLVAEDPRYDTLTLPIHLISFYRLGPLLPYVKPTTGGLTVEGRSALWLASHRNDSEMVAELLKLESVDVNLDNGKGWSPLMAAAAERSANALKTLLCDPRVDVNKQDKHGFTALHLALQGEHSEEGTQTALNLIAAPGVDVNATDKSGRTPLMLAYNHPTRLLDALIHHPSIDLHKRDHYGRTPLMHACEEGRSETVHRYLRFSNVDARDKSGATALMYKARYRPIDWPPPTVEAWLSDFRALLDVGLDVNAKDLDGRTALAHAARQGSLRAVQALLQIEHVDAKARDYTGRTVLMHACSGHGSSNLETLKFLFNRPETDLNATDNDGRTALMYSILSSDYDIYEREPLIDALLHRSELQIDVEDNNQMTAIAHAVITGVLLSTSNLVTFFLRADDVTIASQGAQDGRRYIVLQQGKTGGRCELFEVPEVAVHLRVEEPDEEDSDRSPTTHFYATAPDQGGSGPSPPSLYASLPAAPWQSQTITLRQADFGTVEKRLDAMEALGLGFPWKTGWIAKSDREASLVRRLLNHPGAEDRWFGYLRSALSYDDEVSNSDSF